MSNKAMEIPNFSELYRNGRAIGMGICGARTVRWNETDWIAKSEGGAGVDAMSNEVGAYLLANAMRYLFVPETHLVKDADWNLFTIQKKVPNVKLWHSVTNVSRDVARKLAHVYLFDYLAQNSDRHGSNMLLADGKEPIAIDHHLTFTNGTHLMYAEYTNDMDMSVCAAEFVYRFNHADLNELNETIGQRKLNGVIERMRLLTRHAWRTIQDIRDNTELSF